MPPKTKDGCRPQSASARPPSQNDLGPRPRTSPPQLLVANHGRRYVFSQPILDHICTGNASHLEHSRPGAYGRRVSPAVDTTTWHSETPPLPQSRSIIPRSKQFTFPSPKCYVPPTSPSRQGLRIPSLCQLVVTNSASRHSHLFHFKAPCNFLSILVASRLSTFPTRSRHPSPCTTLTFSKSDLTNPPHQHGNPTLPQLMVKAVSAYLLTLPLPTVAAPKILPGMVMVVVTSHGARAAAGVLLERIRNEPGGCPSLFWSRLLIPELQPWRFSWGSESR